MSKKTNTALIGNILMNMRGYGKMTISKRLDKMAKEYNLKRRSETIKKILDNE